MVIDEFMQDYRKEYPNYAKLAQFCAEQCESVLERNGIRAIVTYRAKRFDRLRDKVIKRASRKEYKSVSDIYKDVRDLAGVRIALYFPGDRDEVDAFIRSNFVVEGCKDFPQEPKASPYPRRFNGYSARHYRVHLPKESLSQEQQVLAGRCVEIQLGSVLMHAWAEVEHDLAYKPQSGVLSKDEYAILDELNGLVHTGEIALERLQEAVRRRISSDSQAFSNHYELSSFIYSKLQGKGESVQEPFIGRADVLYEFLRLIGYANPTKLAAYVGKLNPDAHDQPIVEQLVDLILSENEELYQEYNRARLRVSESDPYGQPDETVSYFSEERALGFFMRRWIAMETVARSALGEALANQDLTKLASLREVQSNVLDQDTLAELDRIRKIRNQVVFGRDFPSESQLMAAGRFLEQVLDRVSREEPAMKQLIHRALGRIS